MVDVNLVAKPAYNEMQLLTKSLRGETFTRTDQRQPSDTRTTGCWSSRPPAASGPWRLGPLGMPTLLMSILCRDGHSLDLFSAPPFYVNPIPEPGAFVLLGTGLIGVLAYAWRKRK